ncbi:MAG: glycosidase [Myxococcota bacterium]|jgi:glycosidase
MSDAAWWRTGAVYQIYPRSFQDSNGDGIGDLPGLRSRLDWVEQLGVRAVWLSPVHPSPQADFGYDVADYCDVDPVFGNVADMDHLIADCHARGLKVILDGVFNHTSDQHDWFTASRADKTNDKRDWYIWRDTVPNNWKSIFGGTAWTKDAATGSYYLHSFLPAQPDLNWRNPEVVDAVLDVLRFWFERGVDGFRLDVFNSYLKHPDLPSNPRRWHPGALAYGYVGQHHVHDRDQPDLPKVLGQMRALADEYGAVLIGETLDERFRYDRATDFVGDDQLHMAFHFALLHSRWTSKKLASAIRRQLDALPKDGWPTWVLSNHDFQRHPTRWGGGDERAKAAAIIALTLPGTPFLYYGEELGMVEGRLKKADIVDPPGIRFWPIFKGRDGARTPMQWTAEGGFTTGVPWLPMNPDIARRNAEAPQTASIVQTYRGLLALRHDNSALRNGTLIWPPADHADVLSWQRVNANDRVRVLVNTVQRSVLVPGESGKEVLWSTAGVTDVREPLAPNEGRVVRV